MQGCGCLSRRPLWPYILFNYTLPRNLRQASCRKLLQKYEKKIIFRNASRLYHCCKSSWVSFRPSNALCEAESTTRRPRRRVRTHAVLLLTLIVPNATLTLTLTFDLSIICFWVMLQTLLWNALIDPVTLTSDLWIPKPYHFFKGITRSFPIPSLNTLGSFVFELCSGQTNRQTNTQTDGPERGRRG